MHLQQLLLEIKEMLSSVLEMLRRDGGAVKQEDEAVMVSTLSIILLVLPHSTPTPSLF